MKPYSIAILLRPISAWSDIGPLVGIRATACC